MLSAGMLCTDVNENHQNLYNSSASEQHGAINIENNCWCTAFFARKLFFPAPAEISLTARINPVTDNINSRIVGKSSRGLAPRSVSGDNDLIAVYCLICVVIILSDRQSYGCPAHQSGGSRPQRRA